MKARGWRLVAPLGLAVLMAAVLPALLPAAGLATALLIAVSALAGLSASWSP